MKKEGECIAGAIRSSQDLTG